MKIKNTLCLHILMALLAILVLCVHPLVTSFDPPLTFQPLIKSMAGTPKEQAEKIATISHALEGNAIFFIGRLKWLPQKMNITLYIITLISNCTNPSWRMAMRYVDDETQFLLFSRFKNSLNANSKVVLLLAPDSFYSKGLPPAIFADNFPGSIFDPLMKDPQARLLVNYLKHIEADDISHLSFGQMAVYGWHPDLIWEEVSFQFANFCTLIKNDWLACSISATAAAQPWPHSRQHNDARLGSRAGECPRTQQSTSKARPPWMDKTFMRGVRGAVG
jgi:D-alanine transfer protein